MIKRATHAAIFVNDIDEALKYYTETLGFEKRMDNPMGENDRWVTITAKDQPDFEILLQPVHWGIEEMSAEERAALVGKQPGFIFETDDVQALYDNLKAKGVTFTMEITSTPWGTQTAFKDLYGNIHLVSQPPEGMPS